MTSPWHKARDLLQDALLEVQRLSSPNPSPSARTETQTPSQVGASSSSGSSLAPSSSSGSSSVPSRLLSAFEEHRRIYGYKPLAASKGKRSRTHSRTPKRLKTSTYTKDTICIMYREQTWLPTTEERIELAKLGLGLKKLTFDADGDAQHIHDTITRAYPVLISCGGYTLMRLAENSRELVCIDGPDGGMTIPFLKDILRQAKLYVRPLQTDITVKEAKKLCTPNEMVRYGIAIAISFDHVFQIITFQSVEPEESCRVCKKVFPLSLLQQHVNGGCNQTSQEDSDNTVNDDVIM